MMYLTGACRTDPKATIIEIVFASGNTSVDTFSMTLYIASTLSMQLGREIWFYVSLVIPTLKPDPAGRDKPVDQLLYQPIYIYKVKPGKEPVFTVDLLSADAGADENEVFPQDQVRGMADVEARFLD